ncbi:MAG: serine/threonine-protein kinase [Pseudomonadota bacterium]
MSESNVTHLPSSNGLRAARALGLPSRFGRYDVLRTLGESTHSTVYLAADTSEGRNVALKVLDPRKVTAIPGETARQLFMSEARAAMGLQHPNIAAVYDVGQDGAVVYAAMENVHDGRSLAEYCRPGAPRLDIEDAIRIVRNCADALNHAHEHGIIHRNIKPTNILLGVGLEPKLVDFGGSQLSPPSASQHIGVQPYLAPEQIIDRPVDGRADIFALGVVLYELLAGRYPFPYESVAELYRNILKERHVPVRKYRSDTPRVLEMISNRCLAKRPANRYETAMHLMANLDVASDVLASSSSGVAKAQIFARARRIEQFAEFSDQELKELVLNSKYVSFKPGDEIIAKGDQASCLYIVIDGEVGVRKDALEFIHLEAGECVGEIGALTGKPRTATVVALDRCGLLSIPTSFLNEGPISCQLPLKNLLLRTLADRFASFEQSLS